MKQALLVLCCIFVAGQMFSQGYQFNTTIGPEGTKFYADGYDNNTRVAKSLQTPSGKILLAINSSYGGYMVQLNSDGTRDESFSFKGVIGPQGYFEIADMAIDPNSGNIVYVSNYPGTTTSTYFVTSRLQSNGFPDPSFSTQYTTFGGSSTVAGGIDVYYDGSIIVGGTNYQFGAGSYQHAVFAKFQSTGLVDVSFNGNGKLSTSLGSNAAGISDVHFDDDGNIVFCGTTVNTNSQGAGWENFMAGRLLPSGALDPSFNGAGYNIVNMSNVPSQEYDYARACALQTDGKLVVGGKASYNSSVYVAVARFKTNGTLDNAFDGDGKLYLRSLEGNNFYDCTDIVVTPGSDLFRKIFLGCRSYLAGQFYDCFGVVALTGSGGSYAYFNNGNQSTNVKKFAGSTQNDELSGLTLLSDNSLLAAGYTDGFSPDGNRYSVEKFDGNTGNPDLNFQGNGTICSALNKIGGLFRNVTSSASNNVYGLHQFTTGANQFYIDKIDPVSGNLVPGFGNQGTADLSGTFPNLFFNDVEPDAANGVFALGYNYSGQAFVCHLLQNGNADPAFGSAGLKQFSYRTDLPVAKKNMPDGGLLLGAYNGNDGYILKINSSGTEDVSFSANANPVSIQGTLTKPKYFATQSTGKILCLFEYFSSGYKVQLRRFNPDGSPDLSFGNSGNIDFGSFVSSSEKLFLDASDNIYFSGIAENYTILWEKLTPDGIPQTGVGTGDENGNNSGEGFSTIVLSSPSSAALLSLINDGQLFCSAFIGSAYQNFVINKDGTLCGNCINSEAINIQQMSTNYSTQEMGITVLSDQTVILAGVKYFPNGSTQTAFLQFLSPPPCSPVIITQQPVSTQSLCQDQTPGTLHVEATGTVDEYDWYVNDVGGNSSGQMISVGQDFVPPVSTPGTKYYYCVLVSSCGNVTSETSEVVVKQFLYPQVDIFASSNLCAGQQQFFVASATGTGDNPEYHWIVNNIDQSIYSQVFEFTPTGGEQVTCHIVATGDGCFANGPIAYSNIIIIHEPITAEYVKQNKSSCSGVPDGTIWVNAIGGSGQYTFEWNGTIGSGNPSITPFPDPGSVSSLTGLEYGFYNVLITDQNGCGSYAINNIHIQNAYLPYITTGGSNSSACAATGSITVYATSAVAPYNYRLDNGTPQNDNTFINVNGGSHMITVTDARGCSNTKTVTVGTVQPVSMSFYVTPASSCNNDGAVKINRIGGIAPYEFSVDGGSFGSSNLFSGLAGGGHTASIRDSKGCTANLPFEVGQGAGLTLTTSRTNSSACTNDGSIQVNASGGVGPYLYAINGGINQTSNSFAGLSPGNYVITVTDTRGCFNTTNVTIGVNYIVVSYLKQDAPDCFGTGWIKVLRTGGVNPYTYSLDGNNYSVNNYFTNIPPGTYTAFVKDARTCVGQTDIALEPVNCGSNSRMVTNQAQALSSALAIYPNPFHVVAKLIPEYLTDCPLAKVSVYDYQGKLIWERSNVSGNIELGKDWLPGIYTVSVLRNNKRQSYRLIKY